MKRLNILHIHNNHNISEKELYEAYKIFFGTLVSESRLKIINILKKGRKNVSELIEELKMNQTHISHDLQRLKRCGFVLTERDGKYIYYSLNKMTIKPLMLLIDKHMGNYCIHILRNNVKGGGSK
ncbi:MAG: metalloregulator ArsR/SmtB family transcription factor [Candidatus Pacearchaeota archaeon]